MVRGFVYRQLIQHFKIYIWYVRYFVDFQTKLKKILFVCLNFLLTVTGKSCQAVNEIKMLGKLP